MIVLCYQVSFVTRTASSIKIDRYDSLLPVRPPYALRRINQHTMVASLNPPFLLRATAAVHCHGLLRGWGLGDGDREAPHALLS